MNDTGDRRDAPVSVQLHPLIYRAITGMVLCLGLAILGIAVTGPVGLGLSVLSLVGFAAIALVLLAWRHWSAPGTQQPASREPESFATWVSGEFDTWETRLRGSDAAVLTLLPIAAVALGMSAFALAWHLAAEI